MTNDARTHDIHRQVAVKIVCQNTDFSENEIEVEQYDILFKNVQIILNLIDNKSNDVEIMTDKKEDEDLPF